jgi:plastocyanin
MDRQIFLTLCSVSVLGFALALPVQAQKRSTEEMAPICAKAARKYEKVFGHPASAEKVKTVIMYKYTFCPPRVTIRQGESVRWVNIDYTSHSTWFRQAGKAESERLFRKESREMKFDLPPGEYPYLCGPHWQSDDMMGKVVVLPVK